MAGLGLVFPYCLSMTVAPPVLRPLYVLVFSILVSDDKEHLELRTNVQASFM